MSALDRFSPRERRQLEALATARGLCAEVIAQEMAASYMRLLNDAPAVLPERPLLTLCKRAGRGNG